MTLHVTFKVLLSLKAPFAARFPTFVLHLFDHCREVLQRQTLLGGLLPGHLARRLPLWPNHKTVSVNGGLLELIHVFPGAPRQAAHGSV